MERRKFITKTSLGFTGLALSIDALAKPKIPKYLSKFGIIANTVSKDMEADYRSTLARLAEIGYTHIEGGIYGNSAEEYVKLLKDLRLKPFATGSSMAAMKKDPSDIIRKAEQLDSEYIICYYPWMGSAENLTKKDSLEAAENLNALGKKFKDAGFTLAWHNHAWEFKDIEGETIFNRIMRNTDPDLVTTQLDLYWVVKGNVDPVELIKKYPGRIELVHAKDMDHSTERGMTCVGKGIIDFKRILVHSKTAGIRRIIVENEQWKGDLECAELSYKSLTKLF